VFCNSARCRCCTSHGDDVKNAAPPCLFIYRSRLVKRYWEVQSVQPVPRSSIWTNSALSSNPHRFTGLFPFINVYFNALSEKKSIHQRWRGAIWVHCFCFIINYPVDKRNPTRSKTIRVISFVIGIKRFILCLVNWLVLRSESRTTLMVLK